MPVSLADLQAGVTEDEATEWALTVLTSLGFSATSWQTGSVQRSLVSLIAKSHQVTGTLVAALAKAAFNDTSTGDALTAFSSSHYDNARVTAVAAEHDYTFTGGAVGPPYTIVAGQVTVTNDDGVRFFNVDGGTIPASGTLAVTIRAETPGTAGNLANDTITTFQTPLAGVTGSNAAIAPSTTSLTTVGIDEETDATLRARNTTKWSTLTYAAPAEAYVNMALTADTDITRALTDDSNPRGAGTVDVYIARASGTAQAADVTTVQDYIDERRPVTADVSVIAATEEAQDVTATIYILSAQNTAEKQAEVVAAITAYFDSLPIGGQTTTGATGYVLFSELLHAITDVEGVRSVSLAAPSADVALASNGVATEGAYTLTYTGI